MTYLLIYGRYISLKQKVIPPHKTQKKIYYRLLKNNLPIALGYQFLNHKNAKIF